MEIQYLGAGSYAVTLGLWEFSRENIESKLLPQLGIGDSRSVRVDMLEGKDNAILFIRRSGGSACFFEFCSLEDLISCALACCGDWISSLYTIDGAYILSVYPWENWEAPPVISEYGARLSCSPGYAAHLEEHGRLLIAGDAIASLRQCFSPCS